MGREIVPRVKDTTSAGAQRTSFLEFAKSNFVRASRETSKLCNRSLQVYVAKSPGNRIYDGRSKQKTKQHS